MVSVSERKMLMNLPHAAINLIFGGNLVKESKTIGINSPMLSSVASNLDYSPDIKSLAIKDIYHVTKV